MAQLADRIPVVDADSHVSEPPDMWLGRLPRKWHDLAPRVEHDDPLFGDIWLIGDRNVGPVWINAPAGWKELFPSHPRVQEEVDPAAYDPVARAQRLDEFGIAAQVLYPNVLGFHLKTLLAVGDRAFHLACFRAYNDFLSEFAEAAPNRFVPITSIPFFDLDASLSEIERCARDGHKGILFANAPENVGLPALRDPHWDPLFKLAEEAGLSINFHIGFAAAATAASRNDTKVNPPTEGESQPDATKSADEEFMQRLFESGFQSILADLVKTTVMGFMSNANAITELIVSGLCERYPRLNFVSVESGFGYVPYLIEALDWQWVNYGAAKAHTGWLLPSEYFRRQIYSTFWFEQQALSAMVERYPDNTMFETDFPHPTCIAPGPASLTDSARNVIEANLGGLDESLVRKLVSENAARVYGITPACPTTAAA